MKAADHLGPLAQEAPPAVVLVLEARRRLFAELRRMEETGKANPPLRQPLGTGEPA